MWDCHRKFSENKISYSNLTSTINNSFIFELCHKYCTVMVEITLKIQTSFKKLASKKATTWQLKNFRASINFYEIYDIFQLSHGVKSIHQNKLRQYHTH